MKYPNYILVLSTQFSVLCHAVLTNFYGVSTGLRHFSSCLFGKKTRLGTLDDLHRCLRRNMSTQSFNGGCVCDSTKRFPHSGIYTGSIQSTIAASCHKTTLASFHDTLHRNSTILFPGTKVHQYQDNAAARKQKKHVVFSKKQKTLTPRKM